VIAIAAQALGRLFKGAS
jgi:hypothetical protein